MNLWDVRNIGITKERMVTIKKKIVSVFLSLALLFTICPTFASSANETDSDLARLGIVETIDAYGRITRVFSEANLPSSPQPASITTNDENSYAKIKLLLSALGLDNVDSLSSEELDRYAASSYISVTTAYIKSDEKGNVSYVDKETALQAAALQNQEQSVISPSSADIPEIKPSIDTYMSLTMIVTYEGGDRFHVKVNSVWLTMPFFRGYDCIGASAQANSAVKSSVEASCSYTMAVTGYTGTTTNTYTFDISDSAVPVTNGNYDGFGVILELPSDISGSTSSIYYSNYSAHIEFDTRIIQKNEATSFNVIGSYDHTTMSIPAFPEISIDQSGMIGVTVLASANDFRYVMPEEPISYAP